jgi:hypothetical protein
MEEGMGLSINGAGQMVSHMKKNEVKTMLHTIHTEGANGLKT